MGAFAFKFIFTSASSPPPSSFFLIKSPSVKIPSSFLWVSFRPRTTNNLDKWNTFWHRHVQFSANRKWKIIFVPQRQSTTNKFYHFEVWFACVLLCDYSQHRLRANTKNNESFALIMIPSKKWVFKTHNNAAIYNSAFISSALKFISLRASRVSARVRIVRKGLNLSECKGQKKEVAKINKIKLFSQRFTHRSFIAQCCALAAL